MEVRDQVQEVSTVVGSPGAGDKYFHHRIGTRKVSDIEASSAFDEQVPTATSVEQRAVERSCLRMFELFAQQMEQNEHQHPANHDHEPILKREKLVKYLRKGLTNLSKDYQCLDASRPWILYWIMHSLELLGETFDAKQTEEITDFLSRCQNSGGGFGGGPGQISHLAPTYATVNALCILGVDAAYKVINRESLVKWLNSLRLKDGSFVMHEGGEVDVRGVYCALSIARLTNIYYPELFKDTAQWVLSCQTYEGGFGGAPGTEAHGGYSFCGVAALILLDHGHLCNVDNLLRWTANRQMALEGGFQGRTNKLVDGCYSFWQGGIFPLLRMLLTEEGHPPRDLLFDCGALQEYLLICCQDRRGGLVDKPGKGRDYYHTCYTLSGLSVAQYSMKGDGKGSDEERIHILGSKENKLKPTHPLYNIGIESAISAAEYFDKLEIPKCQ